MVGYCYDELRCLGFYVKFVYFISFEWHRHNIIFPCIENWKDHVLNHVPNVPCIQRLSLMMMIVFKRFFGNSCPFTIFLPFRMDNLFAVSIQ